MIRRRFPIEHNVYNRAVTMLVGTADEINRALKRDCPPTETHEDLRTDAAAYWRVFREDGYEADYLCLVRDGNPRARLTASEISFLAHEVMHHTSHALRTAGLDLSRKTDEAYCYYLGWMLKQCLRVVM